MVLQISVPQPLGRSAIIQHQAGHSVLIQLGRVECFDVEGIIGIPAQQIAVVVMLDTEIVKQIVLRQTGIAQQLLVCAVDGLLNGILR